MKAALDYNQDGLKLYEDIYKKPKLDDFPLDRKVVRAGLAEAYTRVGVSQYRMGELTAGAGELPQGLQPPPRAGRRDRTTTPGSSRTSAIRTMALAETTFRLGDRDLADDFYRQALDQREAMVQAQPNDLAALKELGDVYYMIGEFKLRCGDLAAARRNLEKSRDRRKDLVDREPRNVLLGRDLGMSLYRLGNLADLEKKPDDARQVYEASLKIREELAKISENNDRRQTELMLALAHAGQTDARDRAGRSLLRRPERRPRAAHFPRPLATPSRPGHSPREGRASPDRPGQGRRRGPNRRPRRLSRSRLPRNRARPRTDPQSRRLQVAHAQSRFVPLSRDPPLLAPATGMRRTTSRHAAVRQFYPETTHF